MGNGVSRKFAFEISWPLRTMALGSLPLVLRRNFQQKLHFSSSARNSWWWHSGGQSSPSNQVHDSIVLWLGLAALEHIVYNFGILWPFLSQFGKKVFHAIMLRYKWKVFQSRFIVLIAKVAADRVKHLKNHCLQVVINVAHTLNYKCRL